MEIENKLDEDFLFYSNFTSSFVHQFPSQDDNYKCEAWLQKLMGEEYIGIEEKKNRNIFLANLILCLQDAELAEPFKRSPPEWNLPDATESFGPVSPEIKEPAWMRDVIVGGDDYSHRSKDGRTYLATKAMPDGQGAFGYIAVSLAEEEPQWIEHERFDAHMAAKFEEHNPPITDMERILINRRNPEERQRIVLFYESLLDDIKKELEGKIRADENVAIEALMSQLIGDLQKRGVWDQYEAMSEKKQRTELLLLLDERVHARRDHVARREEFLDHVEQKVLPESFFETSVRTEDIYKEDKEAYANKMWEQAINDGPKPKMMNLLQENYPPPVVKKFLILLAREKEKIAMIWQRRHEGIVSQMKKELRKENEKGKKRYTEVKTYCEEVTKVLDAVKTAEAKALESQRMREERIYGARKERDEMYEQMRATLLETQRSVEEEAQRGKILTEAINNVNKQTELYQNINEESIRKVEDENIQLMKHIKRLNTAITQHEHRLRQMQQMASKRDSRPTGSQVFFV